MKYKGLNADAAEAKIHEFRPEDEKKDRHTEVLSQYQAHLNQS
jgi:hypothetical protein